MRHVVPALTILLALVGTTHTYLWARLVRDAALPSPWYQLTSLALGLLALSMPAALLLLRGRTHGLGRLLGWVAFTWMGLFFLLLMMLLSSDLLRLLAWPLQAWQLGGQPPDLARRQLLARVIAAGVAGGGALAAGLGMRTALRGPRQVDVSLTLARLPAALDGLRIVQISDLHVATLLGRSYVEQVVSQTLALAPDLIVLTGDMVDGTVAQLASAVAPLARLRAPCGVFMCTGNHEYYSGVEAWLEHFRSLGIKPLHNERVAVGRDGASFDLAGIDDFNSAGMAPGHGPDLARAVAGRDPSRALVLLAHQPRHIDLACAHGVDLMLSGHTHGGQIFPFAYLVRLVQPFVAGRGRQGDTQIYVSRGTGYWGPPMRLGAPPELTHIRLGSPGQGRVSGGPA